MSISRSFWVTGASRGLGLALVEQLLDQGHRVAASSQDSRELDTLSERYGSHLLRLPDQLQDADQASAAGQRLQAQWGAIDGLLINAGTCDYLPSATLDTDLFEMIITSNQRATEHALANALPLLTRGDKPQVMAILSRYSALQLYEPTQPLSGVNSLPQWLREQRQALQALGVDLTVAAPQSLQAPSTLLQFIPEQWTPQSAAMALAGCLELRKPELVLEALSLNSLWPLPH
ncbi:MAG: SDR family oxidoreductase [Paucimonas sp.]|nr:SDR family oxidoreductase [Paucimonas sp.]